MTRKGDVSQSAVGKQRAFLFLQGPLSSFYSKIADVLIDQGEAVYRVNFCGNDARDWRHDRSKLDLSLADPCVMSANLARARSPQ
jgi:capsule polysaccharide modification protein KpsS